MQKKITVAWLLIIAFFTWVVLANLMQDGMFIDGVLYSSVARNFSLGMGSFWNMHFSKTVFNNFHEQPPLFFLLQSVFFKIIGDNIYPERVYCLVMSMLTAFVIIKFWKEIASSSIGFSWLPVLLWISIPVVSWGLINNVIENTLLLFDLLAVYFLFRIFKGKSVSWNLFFSFLFLFAASLSKGIQGLFPLAVPVIYFVSTRKISFLKSFVLTALLVSGLAITYALLLMSDAVFESYKLYFASRFPGFPHTPNQNTEYRIYMFFTLLSELIVPGALAFIAWLIYKKQKIKSSIGLSQKQLALFFVIVGLSASLPLMFSFEQRRFYLITSLPYFVFGLSIISEKWFSEIILPFTFHEKIKKPLKLFLMAAIFSGLGYTYLQAGNIKRDKELLHDVYFLKDIIGANKIVSTTPSGWGNWAIQNYFQRYDNISLSVTVDSCTYHLQPVTEGAWNNNSFKKINLETKYFDVYERIKK
ncbi:MAG: glycosyltransferase family 39 protein [Bacteroidota bacterium]